jgi:RNA polymerase subunit RPABC4/transcription elongation factor Spt4
MEALSDLIFLFVLLSAIACAALAAKLAKEKGYSTGAWGACGFFLGILGLIAAAGLPSVVQVAKLEAPRREELKECPRCGTLIGVEARVCEHCGEEQLKRCPMCAELIRREARVCRYCGRQFSEE